MSRFQFEAPSEAEAREFLAWRQSKSMYQGELYRDALACVGVIEPATTAFERAEARDFRIAQSGASAIETFACSSCGRFAFPRPTQCCWCRSSEFSHRATP